MSIGNGEEGEEGEEGAGTRARVKQQAKAASLRAGFLAPPRCYGRARGKAASVLRQGVFAELDALLDFGQHAGALRRVVLVLDAPGKLVLLLLHQLQNLLERTPCPHGMFGPPPPGPLFSPALWGPLRSFRRRLAMRSRYFSMTGTGDLPLTPK